MIRSPSLSWALRLNPNFSLAQGYYGLDAGLLRALAKKADLAARRALRLSPRDPFSAVYYRYRLLRPVRRAQLRGRPCGWHARVSDNAPISSALTGCSRPQPEWPDRPTSPSAALQELLRAQPNISLAWLGNQMPIQRDSDREHYLEGFRRAGLE